MKKLSTLILSFVFALSLTGPALAEEVKTTETKAPTAVQVHTAAIKKANADYRAMMNKAEGDYRRAMEVAKAALKKSREEALATMKAAKKAADAALKAEMLNKRATLKVGDSSLGKILVANNGMTLYLKKDDSTGKSTCYGDCAKNWPPLLIKGTPTAGTGVTGKVDRTVRTDGRFQVTYNGMPLYFWKSDIKPGDTTGNGVNGIWSVVTP